MEVWRWLDTGAARGAYNMAFDQVLVEGVRAGGPPVLRFYAWERPAVSLGYAQRPEREIEPLACRARGFDLVRRPTGGRAVLHWQELTYSVVCRRGDGDIYRRLGQCLLEGLRRYGVEAEWERAAPPLPSPRGAGATAPCFTSAARWEIKCGGRKLVGSAQRRFGEVVLQHGSLITGPAHGQLVDVLRLDEEERARWREELRRGSTCLRECCGRAVDRAELVACLRAGFAAVLGAALEEDTASAREVRRALETASAWEVEVEERDAAERMAMP